MTTLFIASTISRFYGEVDLFFNEQKELISMNNLNDAQWRHEYFDGVFSHIGVTITQIDIDNDETFKASVIKKHPDFFTE